jgi:hypothetical protein
MFAIATQCAAELLTLIFREGDTLSDHYNFFYDKGSIVATAVMRSLACGRHC